MNRFFKRVGKISIPFIIAYTIVVAKLLSEYDTVIITGTYDWILRSFSIEFPSKKSELLLKNTISFVIVTFVSITSWYTLIFIYNLFFARRIKTPRKAVSDELSEIKKCHTRVLSIVERDNIEISSELSSIWLEYIVTDISKIISHVYDHNGFRVAVYCPIKDPETNNVVLKCVATSIIDVSDKIRTYFDNGEGFCGNCFSDKKIHAGSYRHGIRGFWRKNSLFTDNKNPMRQKTDRTRSFLCLPVIGNIDKLHKNHVVGVFCIDSDRRRDFINPKSSEIDFLALNLDDAVLPIIENHLTAGRYHSSNQT